MLEAPQSRDEHWVEGAVYSNGVAIRVMLEYIDYWGDQRVGDDATANSREEDGGGLRETSVAPSEFRFLKLPLGTLHTGLVTTTRICVGPNDSPHFFHEILPAISVRRLALPAFSEVRVVVGSKRLATNAFNISWLAHARSSRFSSGLQKKS